MKYGVVIFPSKKLQDLANSYRKRYDSHYALIPPHLTLKEGFETEEKPEKLTEMLDKIVQKYQPLQLKFLKVSSFQPITNTIYLKVKKTDELDRLHEELCKEMPGDPPEHPFVPHVTIGQKLSNDEHSDVFGALGMLGVDHEETVDRIHLVYQLENGSWSTYETIRLGKD
ncbi:putative phosphoesterase YjcG [Bacillus sp. J14TS2]|uniref:YjcG family protein n=1 Tax=Bacillus sp. J14TS2 TaxID=2807188 RepID=UPI001B005B82|nr:YjcG family protein [Bacillus sp. J14TS2]GIN74122.1 putative phosphoesterase YjcG [Bacillus sp. J14TS2]